jgi:hypothetical protein
LRCTRSSSAPSGATICQSRRPSPRPTSRRARTSCGARFKKRGVRSGRKAGRTRPPLKPSLRSRFGARLASSGSACGDGVHAGAHAGVAMTIAVTDRVVRSPKAARAATPHTASVSEIRRDSFSEIHAGGEALINARGACRYCNRRIDLEPNDPAPTVGKHTVVRGLLLRRKKHRKAWAKKADSKERVVCPGSRQVPKRGRDSERPLD